MRKVDLTGKKFNRLTVLKFTRYRSRHSMWECLCECGNICEKSGPHLQTGWTTSCGCLRMEKVIRINKLPRSNESRLKISLSMLGKRGAETRNWQGGKAPFPKRMRWTPEYKQLRRKAYERDGFKCGKCGETEIGRLSIHHIVPWVDDHNLWFELSNMKTLCRKCHWEEHPTWPKNHASRREYDVNKIIELRDSGMFYEDIAKEIGLNRNAISKIYKKNKK